MKIKFKFLAEEPWSIYGTLNTLIILILLKVFKQDLNLETLILSSILCMMKGDIFPKILFTGFLNFLIMKCNIKWITQSILFVFSTILIHYIPYKNKIHRLFIDNYILKTIFRLSVIFFMLYLLNLIYNNFFCIFNLLKI